MNVERLSSVNNPEDGKPYGGLCIAGAEAMVVSRMWNQMVSEALAPIPISWRVWQQDLMVVECVYTEILSGLSPMLKYAGMYSFQVWRSGMVNVHHI